MEGFPLIQGFVLLVISGKKRSLGSHCFFSEEDYKVSIPEKLLQRYKEALISILAILKQTNLDSIEQIRIIRNTQLPSERENKLLEKLRQEDRLS